MKDTAEQALSSPTTLKTQPPPVEPITLLVNQSSVQTKGEVETTLKELSKSKAAGATEVTPESSTHGLDVQTPNEPRAEPHKKKKKKTKKNMDGGENLVANGKPKKSHKKTEKENVDYTSLSTVPEKPVADGTKKVKKKNKVTPIKVKGIALTTKISSKGKEAEKSKESESQPGKSTKPRTSAK
ncbi:hypothetical protein COL26b_013347 [Colletotrichum chrysophilum]|uniref:uncharacterized protein n=1 Tax=Colletotrichum chrysophilum TaxID=1836956 RepID=UPI002300D11F|nr:uncharacterized protein COL26b_013347 [Colletotrichum chrysophilum]KAJ0362426.1 hypothetical protein COL26b_013347 [Colletotrichum chrysophilum]